MKNNIIVILSGILLLGAFETCKITPPGKVFNDTHNSGEAVFVSDESFTPILDQELYIFKNDYPKAKPSIVYRSENDAVKYLLTDSARFCFLSRSLSTDEINTLKSHNLPAHRGYQICC